MKALLDLLPAVAFLAAYYFGDIYAATVALIVSMFVTVAGHWLISRKLHKAHLIGAIAALLLGGVTLAFRDPDFIKLKPSVVYTVFALALAGSHFIGGKVLLQRIPQKMLVMPDAVWKRVNACWSVFFLFCAALNYLIAYHYDESTWVQLKAYGFSVLMMAFMLAHLPFLSRYMVQEESGGQ